MHKHAASFIAHTEASTGAELPGFIKDEFDAFLECRILAHGFLRLRCSECGHDKLLAFSCKRRGFCPSCGVRRMSQTAVQLVDHVIPHVPVRQWVLSLPIALRMLLAAQPELVTPVLHGGQRVVTRHLLDRAGAQGPRRPRRRCHADPRQPDSTAAPVEKPNFAYFSPLQTRLGACAGPCLGGRAEPIVGTLKASTAQIKHGAEFARGLAEVLAAK